MKVVVEVSDGIQTTEQPVKIEIDETCNKDRSFDYSVRIKHIFITLFRSDTFDISRIRLRILDEIMCWL